MCKDISLRGTHKASLFDHCSHQSSSIGNMQRHIKNVHKARNDNETSRNSNGSHTDENFNEDPIDIDNVPFDIVS